MNKGAQMDRLTQALEIRVRRVEAALAAYQAAQEVEKRRAKQAPIRRHDRRGD